MQTVYLKIETTAKRKRPAFKFHLTFGDKNSYAILRILFEVTQNYSFTLEVLISPQNNISKHYDSESRLLFCTWTVIDDSLGSFRSELLLKDGGSFHGNSIFASRFSDANAKTNFNVRCEYLCTQI